MFDDLASQPVRDPSPEDDDLSRRLGAFCGRLEDEAKRRVGRRTSVENRWLTCLRQYHGVYEDDTTGRLNRATLSRVFINLTAVKTDAMVARLWDLLFPTDDRNWGISPTPVPEMTESAEAALTQAEDARKRADAHQAEMVQAQAQAQSAPDPAGQAQAAGQAAQSEQGMRAAEQEENEAKLAAEKLQAVLTEAKRRSELMLAEIDDQLTTSQFPKEARDAIEDGCKLGIGILKGPVLGERLKQRWVKTEDGSHELAVVDDNVPAVYRVDPWHFFPDPDVRRIEDSEGVFERHLLSKKQLRDMAKQTGVETDAIRDLLRQEPQSSVSPAYMASLGSMTGEAQGQIRDRYQVWEYSGPVDADDMALLAEAFDDQAVAVETAEIDPLAEVQAKVMFCQGRVLKFGLYPMDSGEPLYSCFNIRGAETSLFGYGIPYIMRDAQGVLNAAYRMMMDNAALGTGPQIVVNADLVEPEDNDWTMRPRKIWRLKTERMGQSGAPPFQTFNIETHQAELANIIALASQTIDEVTAMPAMAQGEQGAGITKTAQGMALLMNSANVSFRRIVKNWDDDITVPIIRRLHHWNMQFSEKEAIKGDYEVMARGSSVLLVREMQAQNLVTVAQLFGDHPVYGKMLKSGDLLRAIFRSLMIAADEIVKTDREIADDEQNAAPEQDPVVAVAQLDAETQKAKMDLRREEMQLQAETSNMEMDARLKIANLSYEATMNKEAEKLNMQRQDLDAQMAKVDSEAAGKDRRMAVEAAMAQRTGVSSGGAI